MEYVVLVNEQNKVLGLTNKATVHGLKTPLHRAFSLFIFDRQKRLLLQQRSGLKKTWPLVWSNSCCGHPALHESNIAAARRRCRSELGIDPDTVIEIAPYRYCFSHKGVMENEICPILVARFDGEVKANTDEVEASQWLPWDEWLSRITNNPEGFSPWCVEETLILSRLDFFSRLD
jgi:isopentenyl-diphosphate delta-isomerase